MTNSKVNPSDITMHSVGTIAEPERELVHLQSLLNRAKNVHVMF